MKNLTLKTALKQSKHRKKSWSFPLANQPANLAWSFSSLTSKDTSYLSHGYHRYPAKFIPQLARKIIENHSEKGARIGDPFMGSGTTILEGLLLGRKAVGTDINPVAVLITQAKLKPFNPDYLKEITSSLLREIKLQVDEEIGKQLPLVENSRRVAYQVPSHERLIYWYPSFEVRQELAIIFAHINRLTDIHLQRFCLCAFSHILKNTSIWLNKSTKPTRDFEKSIPAPLKTFQRHLKKMVNRNTNLFYMLDPLVYERLDENIRLANADARCLPTTDESLELIVTSPPYVTSYEYADLHQLTALWLAYAPSLRDFRLNFIGSTYKRKSNNQLFSTIATATLTRLEQTAPRLAPGVKSYFLEMQECFAEMRRVLKPGGKTAIVIGNTALRKVPILNAEIFVESLEMMDFKIYDIIKRMIPAKILPQTRDQKTGRFASKMASDIYAYPHEFIIIMEKS